MSEHRDTGLTLEQRRIVEYPLRPLLVVAGAGSGKTHTMAARVAWVSDAERGAAAVAPGEVLGLTFTRKAAGELADRLARSSQGEMDRLTTRPPQVSTYHAFAGSLVAEFGHHIGLETDRTVVAEAAAYQIADAVVRDWGSPLDVDLAPATVAARVRAMAAECAEHAVGVEAVRGEVRNALATFEDAAGAGLVVGKWADGHVAALRTRLRLLPLVEAYGHRKAQLGVVDYGDQVVMALALAGVAPVVEELRARHRVVILDEYQDTSSAQSRLLAAAFGNGHPVTAVGDPKQSIFGWRGAGAGTLRRFTEQFRYRDPAGPAHVAPNKEGTTPECVYLSTSWRNDHRVLDVANALATALPADPGLGGVPALAPRPQVQAGSAHVAWLATAAEEATEVTRWIIDRRRPGRTQAVLCRTRAVFPLIAAELEQAGVPIAVLGLGGLLDEPVVLDVVAVLTAAQDPTAGAAALRLLTGPRWALAPHDLDAVSSVARRLGADPDRAGLIEAVAQLAEHVPAGLGSATVDGVSASLSPAAWERVSDLAAVLDQVRDAARRLALPDVVVTAVRALGVDVEAAVWSPDPRRPRRVLDRFVREAAEFTAVAGDGLGGFLAWLEAARDTERGLDAVDADPDPDAVQILTVHAAKGLEWHDVAVLDLAEEGFPTSPRGFHWFSGEGGIPWPVRGDADGLPAWSPGGAVDAPSFRARFDDFVDRARAHRYHEERRLAYVAVTRAQENLLLTGSTWVRERVKPRVPSRFLLDVANLPGVLTRRWVPADVEPPQRRADGVTWPQPVPAEVLRRLLAGTELVRGALPAALEDPVLKHLLSKDPVSKDPVSKDPPTDPRWWRLIEQLLAERSTRGRYLQAPHLSASQLVAVANDPVAAIADMLRPVPAAPSAGATRGTRFHEWIAQRLTRTALLDLDDLPGAADDGQDDRDMAVMQANFEASPWATADVIDVEVPFDVRVDTSRGLVSVRGRIDAIVRRRTGGYDVVDWKTSGPPTNDRSRALAVQLAVYRLAAAKLYDVDIDQVGAAFWYASTGQTVRPVDVMTPAELVQLVERAYDVRLGSGGGSADSAPPVVRSTGAAAAGAGRLPAERAAR